MASYTTSETLRDCMGTLEVALHLVATNPSVENHQRVADEYGHLYRQAASCGDTYTAEAYRLRATHWQGLVNNR